VTTSIALTLLGLGIGVLIVTDRRTTPRADPRASTPSPTQLSLRERALEAQRISAQASQIARDLAAQSAQEQQP
jgi:hypothetical protein